MPNKMMKIGVSLAIVLAAASGAIAAVRHQKHRHHGTTIERRIPQDPYGAYGMAASSKGSQTKGGPVSMQNYVLSFTEARPNFISAAPGCPTCKSVMRFVRGAPIVFSPGLVDASYVCDECGRATKRTVKGG
jgi:hypothetical protein